MLALVVAVIISLAIGSLIEISAQSGQYRAATDSGYGAMAAKLVTASNQTGSQLASLMDGAPQLVNHPIPFRARAILQQGLDEAVTTTSAEASRAEALEPPPPTAGVGSQLTMVMSDRASATLALRSNIDQMLGMTPLPVAGGPRASSLPAPTLLISPGQAATGMTAAGVLFQHADDEYRSLLARIHTQRLPVRLPPSVWVPTPVATAPLGPARLGAAAALLDGSAALRPFHQLIITAVGLDPAPVASGGPQTSIPGCTAPQSRTTAGAPMVMPPTSSLAATVTVTNCGTVVEPVVALTGTLALADPPGTPPPPAGAGGGVSQAQASLQAGSSTALSLRRMAVASGHTYTFSFTIAIPVSQQANNPDGSTQQLLLQISG